MIELLSSAGTWGPEGLVRSGRVDPASRAALERFHRTAYIERVERLSRSGRRIPLDQGDTPSFPGCDETAARIVGGALAGLDLIVTGASHRCFHPAGGLHHAHPDRASGFCIYNDLAVAIASALRPVGPFDRVAYIDIDAHHGDGVMYGFYEDGRLLDIDFHQDGRTIFPGTGFPRETGAGDGAGVKVNVPLPPGTGDPGFLALFERLVPSLLRSFRPQLLVLQCGVDAHLGDRLGATALVYTPDAYRTVVHLLDRLAMELGEVPLLVTGGGGYSAETVSRILASVPRWLAGTDFDPTERLPQEWRSEFAATTGSEAPADWTVRVEPSPRDQKFEESFVGELEETLGRRFPPSPSPTER